MALVDASRAINSELTLDQVFGRVAEHAAAVLGAEAASVLLFDAERHELVFQAAVGPGTSVLTGERFSADLGIAGQALRTGRPVSVEDVRQNRNFFAGIDEKTNLRTRSLIAAPLVHQDRALGVVEVLNPLKHAQFTRQDVELLQVFANIAAAAAANAQEYARLLKSNRAMRESMGSHEMIGRSAPLRQVIELCRKVAMSSANVLLCGETGTGKELAARAIHQFSSRRERPFIAINCAALPESLLESELFGHEKGAFTGATAQKLGRFELAEGGTLFLDEIGEISPAIQSKLLRALQEREFVRVGGTQTITSDARIVAATNRDLKQEMHAGRFREDLYYRLNVFPIHLPPLRERLEDLPLLAEAFVKQVAPSLGVTPPSVSAEAMACLVRYGWPGNVRELRNIIERATLLSGQVIKPECLPPEISHPSAPRLTRDLAAPVAATAAGESVLAEHERTLLLRALQDHGWNQSAAARSLGISRDNLRYRVKKYQLRP